MYTNIAEELCRRIREQRRRIVVCGDVMLDRWVHGHLSTPCQDACPKFVQESVVDTPGGAANSERCLREWDVNTSLYSCSHSNRSLKSRYVDANGRIVFRADEDKQPSKDIHSWSTKLALDMAKQSSAVLLSDYDKGFLTPEFVREVVDLCRDRGIPCVADCKREPSFYAGCILKCNSDYQHRYNSELSRLVFDQDVEQRLVVTAGLLNPVIWERTGSMGLGYDLLPVHCVNHVGAGDCFAAHLTLALSYGFSLKEAAALAHSAGRVYVQSPHNRPPTPAEIAADLSSAK